MVSLDRFYHGLTRTFIFLRHLKKSEQKNGMQIVIILKFPKRRFL